MAARFQIGQEGRDRQRLELARLLRLADLRTPTATLAFMAERSSARRGADDSLVAAAEAVERMPV